MLKILLKISADRVHLWNEMSYTRGVQDFTKSLNTLQVIHAPDSSERISLVHPQTDMTTHAVPVNHHQALYRI